MSEMGGEFCKANHYQTCNRVFLQHCMTSDLFIEICLKSVVNVTRVYCRYENYLDVFAKCRKCNCSECNEDMKILLVSYLHKK